jgi:hypothetical protein
MKGAAKSKDSDSELEEDDEEFDQIFLEYKMQQIQKVKNSLYCVEKFLPCF